MAGDSGEEVLDEAIAERCAMTTVVEGFEADMGVEEEVGGEVGKSRINGTNE